MAKKYIGVNKKSIANYIISITFFSILFLMILNPYEFMQSVSSALNIWIVSVVPSLFPFMFLSKLYLNIQTNSHPSKLAKSFSKIFGIPPQAFKIFILSIMSGYPMGAKLVSEYCKNGIITTKQATKISILCSTSGPIFIIGTIGAALFNNITAGIIVFVSHLLGVTITALLFRKIKVEQFDNNNTINTTKPKNLLGETMQDAIISILTVGGFVAIFYLLVDMLNFTKILNPIYSFFDNILNLNITNTLVNGLFEVTRGCRDIALTTLPLVTKTTLASIYISFGGISIYCQSLSFLNEAHINKKIYLVSKIIHGIISGLSCLIICLLFSFR